MYGKLIDNELIYASTKAIIVDGMVITNPRPEDYINAGYKEIIFHYPEDAEQEYEPVYTETETQIIVDYRSVNVD